MASAPILARAAAAAGRARAERVIAHDPIPAPTPILGGPTERLRGYACPACGRVWNGKGTARYELHYRVVHSVLA